MESASIQREGSRAKRSLTDVRVGVLVVPQARLAPLQGSVYLDGVVLHRRGTSDEMAGVRAGHVERAAAARRQQRRQQRWQQVRSGQVVTAEG